MSYRITALLRRQVEDLTREAEHSADTIDALHDEADDHRAEIVRLRGEREATVQAIEDAVHALDIDDLAAYDIERIARVVGDVFRIGEVERLRGLLAAADEYGDRHVIDLRDDGWTIAHPLSCRASGLFACPLNDAAEALAGPPRIGKFAVHATDGRLVLGERIDEIRREAGRT